MLALFIQFIFGRQLWQYFAKYRQALQEFDAEGYDYVVLKVCEYQQQLQQLKQI